MNKTQLLIIGYGNMIFGAVLAPYTGFGIVITVVGSFTLLGGLFAKN